MAKKARRSKPLASPKRRIADVHYWICRAAWESHSKIERYALRWAAGILKDQFPEVNFAWATVDGAMNKFQEEVGQKPKG